MKVTLFATALCALLLALEHGIAAKGSSDGSASGSGSTFLGDVAIGDNAEGLKTTVVVLSAGQLQDQLLSSSGIRKESPVEVYADYGVAQQQVCALLPSADVTPNTTVFASVLVAPSLEGSLPKLGIDGVSSEHGNSARTQLYYNCTSAPNIWDLLLDTNVQALVNFTDFNATMSGSIFDKQNMSAIATIQITNCNNLRNYSVEQIIKGNSFFDPTFATEATAFRVVTSQVVSGSISTTNGCRVSMELARATLSDLYPDCRIKFYTTDFDVMTSAMAKQPVENEPVARRLEDISFTFLINPR